MIPVKWYACITIFLISVLYFPVYAETINVGGNISADAEWSADTVRVVSPVTILDSVTLNIFPGTYIDFAGRYKLNVMGRILAIGSLTDTITFSCSDSDTGWFGIRFDHPGADNDSSKFIYCKFQYGYARVNEMNNPDSGGALYINNFSKIIIKNCLFAGNRAGYGGAIYCSNSSPIISNSTLIQNEATEGGGIYCLYSNPDILNNRIEFNRGGPGFAGGISCHYSNPLISNNIISNNYADFGAGGIFCWYCNPTIINNVISENDCPFGSGGGLRCYSSSPTLSGNIIINNTGQSGGGIYCHTASNLTSTNDLIAGNGASTLAGGILCNDANPVFKNSTISSNSSAQGGGILCNYNSNPSFENCIIYDNSATAIHNQIHLADTESDPFFLYCDVQDGQGGFTGPGAGIEYSSTHFQHNIDAEPSFSDSLFHLAVASICIDGGNPASEYSIEPSYNGRRINMGVYGNTIEATTSSPEIELSVNSVEFDSILVNCPDSASIWIYNKGLSRLNIDSIYIDDAQGFTLFVQPEEYILGGDSLQLLVKISPLHTQEYTANIIILSNDEDEPNTSIYLTALSFLSGEIAGTLYKQNSPFYINNDLMVSKNSALQIEPGCRLYFSDTKKLVVDSNAVLICNGTVDDSILFLPQQTDGFWGGLIFNNSMHDSLRFVRIGRVSFKNGPIDEFGNCIYAYNSAVNASNSVFEGAYANYRGGAVATDSSVLNFQECTFRYNVSGAIVSGVMRAANSSVVLFNGCQFLNNNGLFSTLITIANSQVNFTKCLVSGNSNSGAPFIESSGSHIEFINNTVSKNNLNNTHFIIADGDTVNFINNIFWDNPQIISYLSHDEFCSINTNYNCSDQEFTGTGNINQNPIFTGEDSFELKPYSPCIDSGAPAAPPDADGTQADRGALYFHHTNIRDNVSGNWTKENSPYIIRGNTTVPLNDTLRIAAGTAVLFENGYLSIKGILLAYGNEQQEITFASIYDTLGNEKYFKISPNDVNFMQRGRLNMKYAKIKNGTIEAGFGIIYLDHVQIAHTDTALYLYESYAEVKNCIFMDLPKVGCMLWQSTIDLFNTQISGTPWGLDMIHTCWATVDNCQFAGTEKVLTGIGAPGLMIGLGQGWGFGFDFSDGMVTNDSSKADIYFYADSIGKDQDDVIQLTEWDEQIAPSTGYASHVAMDLRYYFIKTIEGNYVRLAISTYILSDYMEMSYEYLFNGERDFSQYEYELNHGIHAQNASITLNNVSVSDFSGNGLDFSNVTANISSVNISNNNGYGFIHKARKSREYPAILSVAAELNNGNRIFNNGEYAFYNGSTDTINFTHTYWGNIQYSVIRNLIADGEGYVNFIPWADSALTQLYSSTNTEKVIDKSITTYRLLQNYPNPFNPTTVIKYELPTSADVSIVIFDILGRKVATLIDGRQRAGRYEIEWQANNLPSGNYYCRIKAGEFEQVRKMILLR